MNVGTLIEFLEDFPPDTLVKVFDYDCRMLLEVNRAYERPWNDGTVVILSINED
jgi:hypothetical protein